MVHSVQHRIGASEICLKTRSLNLTNRSILLKFRVSKNRVKTKVEKIFKDRKPTNLNIIGTTGAQDDVKDNAKVESQMVQHQHKQVIQGSL